MATSQQLIELVAKTHVERGNLFATLLELTEERAAHANRDQDGEDGWSIKEILAHLARMDRSYRATLQRELGRPDAPPPAVPDPDNHWLDGVNDRPLASIVAEMERERATTMAVIAGLSLDDLDRPVASPQFGTLTALQWVRAYYRHDRQHVAQIQGRESEFTPNWVDREPDQRRRP